MDRFTRGIAMASARHPWRTIATWVVVLGAVFALAASGGGTFTDDFTAPGSQSARALELLDENFPEAAKGKALVVFAAEDGETLREPPAGRRRGADRRGRRSTTSSPSPTPSRPAPSRTTAGSRFADAHPRRARARDGQAGVRRALRRCRRHRVPRTSGSSSAATPCSSTPRTRRSATRASASWSRCSCCWWCSARSWPPSCRSASSLVAVGAGIGGIILLAGVDGRLGLGDPRRGPRRAGRRHRLRPVHRRPLPGEPRCRSGQPSRPWPTRWAPRARPWSSPAAPSSSRRPPSPSPGSAS